MATTARQPERRSEKLDLRLTASAKITLQQAAAATQRSVTEFVLDCALASAAETLADRTRFSLSPERWDAFLAALDAPTAPPPRLVELLKEPSVFEADSAN